MSNPMLWISGVQGKHSACLPGFRTFDDTSDFAQIVVHGNPQIHFQADVTGKT